MHRVIVICPLVGLAVSFAAFVFFTSFIMSGWANGSERSQLAVAVALFALSVLNAWLVMNWRALCFAPRKFLVPLLLSVTSSAGIVGVVLWTSAMSGLS